MRKFTQSFRTLIHHMMSSKKSLALAMHLNFSKPSSFEKLLEGFHLSGWCFLDNVRNRKIMWEALVLSSKRLRAKFIFILQGHEEEEEFCLGGGLGGCVCPLFCLSVEISDCFYSDYFYFD